MAEHAQKGQEKECGKGAASEEPSHLDSKPRKNSSPTDRSSGPSHPAVAHLGATATGANNSQGANLV